ncbi:MAG: glutamyl-tRNA reductase, partial [Candidatus Heimdallarchaeota archaeon]|nr:glutamyl-tRNA reductase [Candidatus Heimdallarchaeota archaeon]
MRLHCLGINYQSADVNIRELLAFRPEQTQDFWDFIQKEYNDLLDECVILSTCNRVEIYAVSQSPIFEKLEEALLIFQKIDAPLVEDLFYKRVDEQVIAHLMRVSAGLDSMVLGEPQILGQVTDAYKLGLELKICGKVLSKLFQSSIRAGKRVRTETDISKNSMSVSSLAAKMVEQSVTDMKNTQIT